MKRLLIIPLLLISLIISATNYYVKTGGSDVASGTSDVTAWATIAKVNSVSFSPDDVISFNKGNTFSGTLTPKTSGTSGHQITFTSYGSGADPIITSTGSQCMYISAKNYLTVSGIVFNGASCTDQVFKMDGAASYNVITLCEFKNGWSSGVYWGRYVSYCTISHSSIHNNGRDPDHRGYSIYLSGNNNTIEYNSCYSENSYGVHIYNGYADEADANIIRYCFIHDNGSAGIYLSSGSGNQAYYNILYHNGTNPAYEKFGIRIQNRGLNSLVYNNTIYSHSSYGIYIGVESTGCIVKNNIVYGNGGTIQNLGSATLSNNLTTNPYFVNAGGSYLLDTDFKIPSNSAAKDVGTNVSLTQDYFGSAVPYNTIQDIGAHEYEVPGSPIDPIVLVLVNISAGTTQATIGCNVTDDGGGTVSDRGVCWGTSVNPTISDNHNHEGTGIGSFNSYITGLTSGTTYHVRGFAVNESGTTYTTNYVFATLNQSGLSGNYLYKNGKVIFVGNKVIVK